MSTSTTKHLRIRSILKLLSVRRRGNSRIRQNKLRKLPNARFCYSGMRLDVKLEDCEGTEPAASSRKRLGLEEQPKDAGRNCKHAGATETRYSALCVLRWQAREYTRHTANTDGDFQKEKNNGGLEFENEEKWLALTSRSTVGGGTRSYFRTSSFHLMHCGGRVHCAQNCALHGQVLAAFSAREFVYPKQRKQRRGPRVASATRCCPWEL